MKRERRRSRFGFAWRSRPRLWLLGCTALLLSSYGISAIWSAFVSDIFGTAASRDEATQIQVIALDGEFSVRFAGEIIATKVQSRIGGLQFSLIASHDDADFVAHVVERSAIGVTSGQKFLLARWRGVRVTAFAASFQDTDTAVFSLERSEIRSPRDLIGKRVSYLSRTEDAVIFDAMLAQLGLPRGQVHNVITKDGFDALQRGEVDAIVGPISSLPSLPLGVSSRIKVLRPQDYGIHVPSLVYFANSDFIVSRPSVIRRTLHSFILGWQAVYEFPDQAARIVAGSNPDWLSMAEVRFALDQQRSLVRPAGMRIGEFDESRWNTLRDILLFAKLGTETVGLSTAVTYDFLRDVYRKPPELDAAARDLLRSD